MRVRLHLEIKWSSVGPNCHLSGIDHPADCALLEIASSSVQNENESGKKTFPVFTLECIIKKFVMVGCGWYGNILWQKLIWWGVILVGALLGQVVFFLSCVLGENNSPQKHFWLEPSGRKGESDRVIALGFLLTKLTSAWKFIGLLFLKIISTWAFFLIQNVWCQTFLFFNRGSIIEDVWKRRLDN